MARVIAIDVGSTGIKCHGPDASTTIHPFHLWRRFHELSTVLTEILESRGHLDVLALTMSGDDCDGFASRSEGVMHILAAAKAAAVRRTSSDPGPTGKRGWPDVLVWRFDGTFTPLAAAMEEPLPCAGASWLALAVHAASLSGPDPAIIVDAGPGCVDLSPIEGGRPTFEGRSPDERLRSGERIPTGVLRTPVASVVREVPYRGTRCPVVAEPFATTRDVYLLLGHLSESSQDTDTADGRPATRAAARERLARVISAEPSTFGEDDALEAAGHVRSEQARQVRDAVSALAGRRHRRFSSAVVAGPGEFLARRALEDAGIAVCSFAERAGGPASAAATACALWHLALRAAAGGAAGASSCGEEGVISR